MRTHTLLTASLFMMSCAVPGGGTVSVEDGDTIVTIEGSDCCGCDDEPCDDDDGGGIVLDIDTDTDTGPAPSTCDDLPEPSLHDVTPQEDCAYDPTPVDIVFSPEVEWEWAPTDADHRFNELMMTPVIGNMTDDNGDGLINDNDIPDVVFTAYDHPNYSATLGALVVLSGDDGTELQYYTQVTFPDGQVDYPSSRSGVALGDINADGTPEMCFTSASNRLICMTAAGDITMSNYAPSGWSTSVFQNTQPSIADMDGDGLAEVAVGRAVYNSDGSLRFVGSGDNGGHLYSNTSFMVDLNMDGTLELVAGSSVYDSSGNTLWDSGADGYSGVADFNLDGAPELTVIHNKAMSIYDAYGTVLATTNFAADCGSGSSCGGPPTLADFDGDGLPEIGVSGALSYTVWDFDYATGTLSKLWQNTTDDISSGSTGSSVFDFEDDGIAEVIFADEERFYVWRGTDGSDQLGSAGLDPELHASGTGIEFPSLADVDNDGSTEIILASNRLWESSGSSDWFGVRSIGSGSGDAWADSRPVWNQHAYHMTHINDDLSVPTSPTTHWTANNTFRAAQNSSIEDVPGAPQSDLFVMESFDWCFDCDATTLEIWFGVGNQGLAASEPTIAAFVADALVFGEVDVPALAPGESTVVGPVSLLIGPWQYISADMELIVDYGGTETECNEDNNNSANMGLTIANECE